MGYYLVLYNSVTLANRIKMHFKYNKNFLGVIHTPKELSPSGCSYSVKVKEPLLPEIKKVSAQMGLKIKGIYCKNDNGTYKEEAL